MARQLKRWESPRKEGRNDKGRGGSARQRQRKKQFQALRKKLKEQTDSQNGENQKNKKGEANQLPLSFDQYRAGMGHPATRSLQHMTNSVGSFWECLIRAALVENQKTAICILKSDLRKRSVCESEVGTTATRSLFPQSLNLATLTSSAH